MHTSYGIDLDDFVAGVRNLDHHGWLARLADRLNQSRAMLLGEMSRAFAQAHVAEAYTLTDQLKAVVR